MHNNEIQQELIDGNQQQAEQAQKESHFYFALKEFEELVRQFGSEKVLMEMDDESFWALFKWFHRADD